MLKSLTIKNYALVEEAHIPFETGLNILTGETGAGKSLVVGALSALLGERVSATLVRTGAAKAVIEGELDASELPTVQAWLARNDLALEDPVVILRREVHSNGRSRAFVNDTPVTLDQMEAVTSLAVDLHGQHAHQSLLRVKSHLEYVDAYGDLHSSRTTVGSLFATVKSAEEALQKLTDQRAISEQERDRLQFALDEIDTVAPEPGEEEALLAEERRLGHAAELREACELALRALYDREDAATALMARASAELERAGGFDAALADLAGELQTASIAVEEVVKTLQGYVGRVQVDPQRLENVRGRLSMLAGLKKKHAGTIDAILAKRDAIRNELAQIESLDEQIDAARADWQAAAKEYEKAANQLSSARGKTAEDLAARLPALLDGIGMPGSSFEVGLRSEPIEDGWCRRNGRYVRPFPTGVDRAAFEFSANPGEPARPLHKIASGGEISRIMLALKTLVAHADNIPVMIFDEIDSGISGRVAHAVGLMLRRLAQRRQIICITHLPQIASAAGCHFLVEKTLVEGGTRTTVHKLDAGGSVLAVAQLLGGDAVSDTHLASARELIAQTREAG